MSTTQIKQIIAIAVLVAAMVFIGVKLIAPTMGNTLSILQYPAENLSSVATSGAATEERYASVQASIGEAEQEAWNAQETDEQQYRLMMANRSPALKKIAEEIAEACKITHPDSHRTTATS